MWGDIIIAFLLAFITAYVITPYTMRLAKKVGAIDMPSDRRINKRPMPRLGGIAVISGFVVSVIYLLTSMVIEGGFGLMEHVTEIIGFFCGIAVLGAVCFIDDCKDIHPLLKLLAQTISAIIVVACGINIENMDSPVINNIIQAHPWFSYILTVFWIVGITNAINLIDGLDGLSSGITLISCISLMIVFTINESPLLSIILITALAGAISGFLPYNFNPAKTFIGDVGSNFLGFSLAVISILGVAKTYTAIVIVAPIIVLGLPKNMNNTLGDAANRSLNFKKLLEDNFDVKVIMQDERLSSVEANNIMISGGVTRKKRKKSVDSLAANIILQSYLDKRKEDNNE